MPARLTRLGMYEASLKYIPARAHTKAEMHKAQPFDPAQKKTEMTDSRWTNFGKLVAVLCANANVCCMLSPVS